MSDNLSNKLEDFGGRAKEAAGSLGDNDELRREGRADQASAGLKDKVEDAKDAVNGVIDDLKR